MNFKQKNVVITSAVRTAIGSFQGSLKDMQAHELGTAVVKEAIKKPAIKVLFVSLIITSSLLIIPRITRKYSSKPKIKPQNYSKIIN